MKKYLFILAIILVNFSGPLKAQNMYQFNHYIANQGLLNPAYNGTRDIISGLLIHRSQWLGVEGAPMNQALNVHGPIEDTNLGVGLVLVNDHIGFSNSFDGFLSASYKVPLDKAERFISFGLQAGASSIVYDGMQAETTSALDPLFDNKETQIAVNFGFGTYYYSDDYFIGFSIPRFFSSHFDTEKRSLKNTIDYQNLHTYLYGGYVFDWGDFKVKPTLLMKQVYGAPMQFDISTTVLMMERLWLGLSYRTVSEAVFLSEYVINDQFTVRYSFDYPISELNQFNNFGTHEISLQFDFSFTQRPGMRSIRYF